MLKALNARDLGYNWGIVENSDNIAFAQSSIMQMPYEFKDFIHVGTSCGIEGGCNNGSPFQPEFSFAINTLPATIKMKLWKRKPLNFLMKSDRNFVINLQ